MTTINRKQPMRSAEIDLLNHVDTNTADIATQTARLTQEIEDRTRADTTLQSNIAAEAKARTDADTALQNNIAAEARARTDADTALQNNIAAEAKTRTDADTALQNNIAAEARARTDADTALQNSINSVNSKFPVQTDNIGDLQVTNAKLATNAVSTDRVLDKNITVAKLEQAIQDQLAFLQSVPAQEFGTSNMIDVPANSSTSISINFRSTKTKTPIVVCGLRHTTGKLTCIVTGVTNQQFSVMVYNLSSTDASGVTVDWLAISER